MTSRICRQDNGDDDDDEDDDDDHFGTWNTLVGYVSNLRPGTDGGVPFGFPFQSSPKQGSLKKHTPSE